MTDKTYEVFTRTAWKDNPKWPGGLEPGWGEETTLIEECSLEIAKEMCDEWNEENEPGRYGLKAEFRSL